jgi:phenylacetate-CoA ligase
MDDLARKGIAERQLERLNRMLEAVVAENPFYRGKLAGAPLPIDSLESFRKLPFTTKQELVDDQLAHPPFGTNLTHPLSRYTRIHQTSGTTGKPLYWLDTEESWDWWGECWKTILEAAGAEPSDRIFFAFSFGPFIGFWAGWEGARKLGALAIPGGGQSTAQRLRTILDCGATVLVCTPTYALHMASEAKKAGIELRRSEVRITIHAGEPGANIPSTKRRIEEAWGARCFDHPGATEVGAFGFECAVQPGGVHVNESEFIAEVIDPASGEPVAEGQRGELVMTNLGRTGSPVVRYRTGDIVAPGYERCACGRSFMLLRGGVLGRADDMIVVRGVNVFPSAIENIMREFSEIDEFRIELSEREEMRELKLLVEPSEERAGLAEEVASRIRDRLGLRPIVETVPPGSLPRFELKAKRLLKA